MEHRLINKARNSGPYCYLFFGPLLCLAAFVMRFLAPLPRLYPFAFLGFFGCFDGPGSSNSAAVFPLRGLTLLIETDD